MSKSCMAVEKLIGQMLSMTREKYVFKRDTSIKSIAFPVTADVSGRMKKWMLP